MDIRKSKRWHEGIKMMNFTFYKVSKVLLLLFWSYWSKFTRRLCDMLLALNKTKQFFIALWLPVFNFGVIFHSIKFAINYFS